MTIKSDFFKKKSPANEISCMFSYYLFLIKLKWHQEQ